MKKISLLIFTSAFLTANTYSQCVTNDLIYPPNSNQSGVYKTSAKIESAGEINNSTTFIANEGITLKSGFSVAKTAKFSANNLGCDESIEIFSIPDNTTQEEDLMALQQLLSIIETTAESVPCTNAAQWTFTPIGSKACGGPLAYIAYSNQINVTTFLYDVERYTTATNDFNIKWGIISTCELLLPPFDVICTNNKAELVYGPIPIIGENTTFEEDQMALQQLLSNIETIAESVTCTNAAEWTFTAIGSKPCGGPSGYIAYSNQIDETSFLNVVQEYTNATNDFNVKWSIVSTCEVLPPPSGVICNNNDAELVYGPTEIIGENTTFEEDQMALQQLLSSIKSTAESVYCTNPNDWKITPIGSKACGGPLDYIAYPIQINEASFLNDVQLYTDATNDFNIKWGIFSTCDITPAPFSVSCMGGKAILNYL